MICAVNRYKMKLAKASGDIPLDFLLQGIQIKIVI